MTVAAAIWLAIKASRRLQIVLAIALGWFGWQGWLRIHDAHVRREVVATINTKHKETATKAGEARAKAYVPGAADRLKQRYCESCK